MTTAILQLLMMLFPFILSLKFMFVFITFLLLETLAKRRLEQCSRIVDTATDDS